MAPQPESVPPPAPSGDEGPKLKKNGKPKGKKDRVEEPMPEMAPPPPPPPSGEAGPPPPPDEGVAPKAKGEGKPNRKVKGKGKGNGEQPTEPCPEGTVPLEDGSCAPTE
jgi:hypothetical protein